MKGLVIKDINLLKNQKRFLIMFFLIIMCFLMTGMDINFIVGYAVFLIAYLAMGSIGYDEFDNGMAFLFTLPISKKEYVKEKYIFCLGLTGGIWLLINIVYLILMISKGQIADFKVNLTASILTLMFAFLFLLLMLPVKLKYGLEKSRLVLGCFFGGFFLLCVIGNKIISRFQIPSWGMAEKIDAISIQKMVVMGVIVLAIGISLSYYISVAIMQKKEF